MLMDSGADQYRPENQMKILDSGARREFGTGAVRDISEDKGRCDLLPLKFIGDRLESKTLKFIEDYIRQGDIHSLWFAIDSLIESEGMDIHTAILEVSKQYQDGARKYSDRNWEKGMPVHCFIDSGVRHYIKFLRGDTDEPHFRATIWNLLGAIWMHENHPELIDLPFAEKKTGTLDVFTSKLSTAMQKAFTPKVVPYE